MFDKKISKKKKRHKNKACISLKKLKTLMPKRQNF